MFEDLKVIDKILTTHRGPTSICNTLHKAFILINFGAFSAGRGGLLRLFKSMFKRPILPAEWQR
jgi:hypothetical protein